MNSNEKTLSLNRFTRLAACDCLLGEPDIISISETKTISSFFNKDKKSQESQEYYLVGLLFPTTAHFSTYISSKYTVKQKTTYKIKLLMFDAFSERDIHIEINIPGSLQKKCYDMKGQSLVYTENSYDKAYYSSFLRILYPMNYPGVVQYYFIQKVEVLKNFIKTFTPFSYQNALREMHYNFDHYKVQTDSNSQSNEGTSNLAIELLINYLLQNKFQNLIEALLIQIRKISPMKAYEVDLQNKINNKLYEEVICKTSQKMILHGPVNQLKVYQLNALFYLKKYMECIFIGKNLIFNGNSDPDVHKLLIKSYHFIGDHKNLMKSINLLTGVYNEEEKKIKQVCSISHNTQTINIQNYLNSNSKQSNLISMHPDLCFAFDNSFYNRQKQTQFFKEVLKKSKVIKEFNNLDKLLQKIEKSLQENPIFYDLLASIEKQKTWKQLMRMRGQCFWLQSDFEQYENNIKLMSKSQLSYTSMDDEAVMKDAESSKREAEENNPQKNNEMSEAEELEEEKKFNKKSLEVSFDGELSQYEEEEVEDYQLPKASKRVHTSRKQFLSSTLHSNANQPSKEYNANQPSKEQQPINLSEPNLSHKQLCNNNLERLFILLFNDIKLQNALDLWQQRIKQLQISSITSTNHRQIIAMVILKKGFLHKKLLRSKKCEESFKMARKISSNYSVNLVACYQLILLYIQSKNAKGVQFYLFELIKLLRELGVQSYDIVPQWSKPILQFVVKEEGLSILKHMNLFFKSMISLYLRSNYSETDIQKILQKNANSHK